MHLRVNIRLNNPKLRDIVSHFWSFSLPADSISSVFAPCSVAVWDFAKARHGSHISIHPEEGTYTHVLLAMIFFYVWRRYVYNNQTIIFVPPIF